jgi:hypothetical protein
MEEAFHNLMRAHFLLRKKLRLVGVPPQRMAYGPAP